MKFPISRNTRCLPLCLLAFLASVTSAFASPYIFSSTESAAPGDVIFLQGDNFLLNSTNPTVWFHLVTGTETTLTPDVQLADASIASVTNQEITVNLPTNIPMGLYAVWVRDSSGAFSAPVLINQARATSFEYGDLSPGYTFRIFGRNLCLPGVTPVVNFVSSGTSTPATIVTTYPNDSNILQIQAPASVVPGTTYSVTVSNGYGSGPAQFDVSTAEQTILGRSGGADPFNLGVPWGPDFANIAANKIDVTQPPYNADKTGATNALSAIQAAIAAAAKASKGGTVYLPTGTYLINKGSAVTGLNIPANVVLMGDGIGQTVINDASPAMTGYSHFITLSATAPNLGTLSGVTGFTCNQVMTVTGSNTFPPDLRNYASFSTEIFFDHIQVNYAHGLFNNNTSVVYGSFIPQGTSDTRVLVQDSGFTYFRFGNNNYYYYNFTYGSDYIFRNNSFSQTFARLEFLYMTNLLVEGNHFTRDGTFPPPGYGGSTTSGGLESSGADQKILNNTLDAINLPLPYYNDGESILCQAGPIYAGPSGSSTSGVLTSASNGVMTDSSQKWTTNVFDNEIVWITTGSAQGEWAKVNSNTATLLGLDRHWVVNPPAGSHYSITPADSYLLSAVSGATSTTLSDSTQSWPTNFHTGDSVAIVNGPGAGQLRTIVGNSLHTLTVSPAWDENPGTTSSYSINGALAYGAQRWLVKGNTLKDVQRGIIYYLGGYDCVTVDNTLASAGGILLDGWQRSFLNGLTYDRFDICWDNLFADNVVSNPDPPASKAAYYAVHAGLTTTSPLFGTILLGLESRRNILQASIPNLKDNAFGSDETFSNLVSEQTTGNAYAGPPGILGTIFNDNLSISSSNAYELTTADYQTTFWNDLILSCSNPWSNTVLAGGTQASLYTTSGSDPCFLSAGFSGTGTSTGGTNDLVDTGAAGLLQAGTGPNSISVTSTNPFAPGAGSYISVTTGATGTGACVQFIPTTVRTSWGRIFDGRMIPAPTNGKWQVNGGFDFFWRPAQTPGSANSMRPIDLSNGPGDTSGANGLQLAFHNYTGASNLVMEVNTGTGGGGVTVTGTYPPSFAAGQVYHLGATFSTNPTSGATIAKIFASSGIGAILTTGSNATPIATGTFTLNPSIVTNTAGFLGNGAWPFGDTFSNGTTRKNDYAALRLYSSDPGVFPALPGAPIYVAIQPASQTGTVGQSITFSAVVSGSGPFTYQWHKNGANISGSTGTTFAIPSAALSDIGNYSLVVTNSSGSVTSLSSLLTVTRTFNSWQTSNYTAPQIVGGLAAPTAMSANGDGLSNLMEYAFGRNPQTGLGGPLPVVSWPTWSKYLQIEFQRDVRNTDISYIVEVASVPGQWIPIAQSVAGGDMQNLGGANSVTETGATLKDVVVQDGQPIGALPCHFMRIEVTSP